MTVDSFIVYNLIKCIINLERIQTNGFNTIRYWHYEILTAYSLWLILYLIAEDSSIIIIKSAF